MSKIAKLKEMSNMQRMLDESVENEYGLHYRIGKYTLEGLKRALLDELGELNHELKADWCWWKKTQPPVNRDRVLEELCDCWHFALSIDYHENAFYHYEDLFDALAKSVDYLTVSKLMDEIVKNEDCVIENMYTLTIKLGFTFDEVYQEYKRKNSVNYTRLRMGY